MSGREPDREVHFGCPRCNFSTGMELSTDWWEEMLKHLREAHSDESLSAEALIQEAFDFVV